MAGVIARRRAGLHRVGTVIFVTVGTQLKFDRMVGAIDQWAGLMEIQVFSQVGPTEACFSNIQHKQFLEPDELDRFFETAQLVVAHAGMGSIISALSLGKPIIIVPRKASLGEHRNDHQMATAKRFSGRPGVYVAWDEKELVALLDKWCSRNFEHVKQISSSAPDSFIKNLKK